MNYATPKNKAAATIKEPVEQYQAKGYQTVGEHMPRVEKSRPGDEEQWVC